MSERTVFVTGATGFIGRRLAERLHADGARLRCLVRSPERADHLRALGAELVQGLVTDRAALAAGMQGCQLAYHLAAIYDIGVVDAALMERTNVEGTRAFLDALASSGVPRAVYVSTTVALGPADNGESQRTVEHDGPYPTVYHRTKAVAHRLARQAQEAGAPIVIACPAYVYGPGDTGPAGRAIEDLLRKRMPGLLLDPGWFSFVHVDDVAAGLQWLGDHGQTTGIYVLSGQPASMNEYARRVAALGGVRAPFLRFPTIMASMTGRALDAVARLTGWRFPLSREAIAAVAHDRWLHSAARARQEFDWQPRSLDAGLPDAVAWQQTRLKRTAQRAH